MHEFYWLVVCGLCGHQALVKRLTTARWERYNHYNYCHRNVSIHHYYYNVTIIKIRDDTAIKILYPALKIVSETGKLPIKLSL
jgi:hypothetical protein